MHMNMKDSGKKKRHAYACLFFLVGEAGLEPARPQWTLEPESSESANTSHKISQVHLAKASISLVFTILLYQKVGNKARKIYVFTLFYAFVYLFVD